MRKPFDLRDLVEITKSIAAAPEPLGVEAEFCRRSVALGAKAGIVLKPTAGGDAFTPAISYGYPRGATGAVFPLDLHAPYPICNSFRSGEKNWLPSISETRPVLSDIWRAAEAQAIVTLPLGSSDRRIGAVGWVFREPRTFGEPDRRGFAAVAGFLSERL